MKGKFIVTLKAEREVYESALYIAKDNRAAADRFYNAFRATCDLLADMPEIGSIQHADSLLLQGVRMLPVKGFENYLIFYRILSHGVEVIRVLHARRDIAALLEE